MQACRDAEGHEVQLRLDSNGTGSFQQRNDMTWFMLYDDQCALCGETLEKQRLRQLSKQQRTILWAKMYSKAAKE